MSLLKSTVLANKYKFGYVKQKRLTPQRTWHETVATFVLI